MSVIWKRRSVSWEIVIWKRRSVSWEIGLNLFWLPGDYLRFDVNLGRWRLRAFVQA